MNIKNNLLERSIFLLLIIGLSLIIISIYTLLKIGLHTKIPVHWDIQGNPDLFSPAWLGLSIIPFALIASAFLVKWRSHVFNSSPLKNYYALVFAIICVTLGHFFIVYKSIQVG
ncbi:MAG: hypothetical protein AAF429_03950 [Pseudomonadota bacterium]